MRSTYEPADAAALFEGVDASWWVAGGWAIDLWLGERTRPHDDLDIAVLRLEQHVFLERLTGWDLQVATEPGVLRPLASGEEIAPPRHALWCRPGSADDWAFELLLNDVEGGEWCFRRDHAVRAPLGELGDRTDAGIPFLRPEFVLLFKAKQARDRDAEDLRRALPTLPSDRRRWLAASIERVHPGHPWLVQLPSGGDGS